MADLSFQVDLFSSVRVDGGRCISSCRVLFLANRTLHSNVYGCFRRAPYIASCKFGLCAADLALRTVGFSVVGGGASHYKLLGLLCRETL